MEFRWVILIALWTLVSGPIFGVPAESAWARRQPAKKQVQPVEKPLPPR